jgi:hypothetical protein
MNPHDLRARCLLGLVHMSSVFYLRRSFARVREKCRAFAGVVLTLCLLGTLSSTAFADAMDQARRIHDRLAGVPPTDQVLLDMTDDINGVGGRTEIDAANRAMDNPGFYNVTLKNWAAPWTNRDQSVFVPLNDYTATVIGMVRDDVPFNTLLSADIVYVGAGGLGLPAYSMTNNDHYEQMESQGVDLQANLTQTAQTAVTDLPSAAVAGITTTRAAAEAFFVAGTNRAMFRFTMVNHMCRDMEQVKDITLSPDRIRQDVSRSPGGDSRIFLNNCVGCHTGMEPLAQAYAYYDFDETQQRLVYTSGQVQSKYFNNDANFPPGYVTPDDSWANYWRSGQNRLLGWDPNLPGSGVGAASMGAELANSQAFAQCQMKKVFKAVCLREPVDQSDRDQVDTMVGSFTSGSYNMKRSFAEAAVFCKGP